LNDGKSDSSTIFKDLKGGYYDAGDAIKFNFPASFAMTMLSWSVIEYRAKYEAAGELNHVKDIIKWGTDYFLKTFNSSADSIDRLVAQVGFCSLSVVIVFSLLLHYHLHLHNLIKYALFIVIVLLVHDMMLLELCMILFFVRTIKELATKKIRSKENICH